MGNILAIALIKNPEKSIIQELKFSMYITVLKFNLFKISKFVNVCC